MARAPKKSKRKLSSQQATEAIGRLCDHYKRPRSSAGAQEAIWLAVVDGVITIPTDLRPRGRGRPPIWGGSVGLELVTEIDQMLNAFYILRLPKPSMTVLIEELQEAKPDKWGNYNDLEKRYYEARRHWTPGRRLMSVFKWGEYGN